MAEPDARSGVGRTRSYYSSLSPDDLCSCAECLNFRARVKAAYPLVSKYLGSLGADIEKPFESWSVELEDGMILYPDVQYVIIGKAKDFTPAEISGVSAGIAASHPMTGIDEEHFVIELSPFILKGPDGETGSDEKEDRG